MNEERERSATSVLTSEKHTEMMRRLETLNALTDSNRLLREERSSLTVRLDEITLRAEVALLRLAQRESSARLEELTSIQRQLDLLSNQHEHVQQSSSSVSEASCTDKVSETQLPSQPPSTTNIKLMASTPTRAAVPDQQRVQPPAASSSPVVSRTTPTARIRPMVMKSRRVAVQPSVAVSAIILPLVAITAPNFFTATPIRLEVLSPASSSVPSANSASAGLSGGYLRIQRRSGETGDSPSPDQRIRLRLVEEEEEEDQKQVLVINISDYMHPETIEERDGVTRPVSERKESMPGYDIERRHPDEEVEQTEEKETQQTSGEQEERNEELIDSNAQKSQNVIQLGGDQRIKEDPEQEMMERKAGSDDILEKPEEAEANEIFIEGFPTVVLYEVHVPVPELHDVDAPADVNLQQDQQETQQLHFPSLTVVLRPHNINKEFAEAVGSPQEKTAVTRFVFGAILELISVPTGAGSGAVCYILESNAEMEQTRMDLCYLEEGSHRHMPYNTHQVFPMEEMPISLALEESFGVAHQPTTEEQAAFKSGVDLHGATAAEWNLLADGYHGAQDSSVTHAAPPVDRTTSTGIVEVASAQDLIQPESASPAAPQFSASYMNIHPKMRYTQYK